MFKMTNLLSLNQHLTRLVFPLNAFACATLLEEGQVDYLHYGLFDQNHANLREAQEYSTELIINRLPPPGSRILEIGIGLGTTAKKLADLSYHITGIAPDPAQIAIAREKSGGKAHFEAVSFEDYPSQADAVDVILLQESSQYLDPALLFTQARRLLKYSGRILVLDQFALRPIHPEESPLHFGDDFVRQAEHQGFTLLEHLDLSTQATPTLDYILRILDTHRIALARLLPSQAENLAGLRDAVAANRSRYHQRILGYALYHFSYQT